MTQDSVLFIVHDLLRQNDIPYDKEELSFQIQSHPSYPSLHSITGVLDHFGIENIAANVPVSQETLNQLPKAFLAQLKKAQGTDLAIVTQKKTGFTVHFSSSHKETLSREQFLERFTGVVVVVEKENNSHVPIPANRWLHWMGYASLIILLALFILSGPDINVILYTGLSLMGLLFSLTVVKQESGVQTVLGNAFCSEASDKKDCNAVLTSKAALLFGKYKFSDLSISYFFSLSLVSLLFALQQKNLDVVFYVSLFVLPVTIYSVYYQYFIIKKWCSLCICIITVLLAQAALSYFFLDSSTIVNLNESLLFVSVILGAFTIWGALRTRLDHLEATEKDKAAYFRFKRNFEVFTSLLDKSPYKETYILQEGEIIFGNADSNLSITIITNPFCIHCKSVHQVITDILHKNYKEVRVTIRFNVNVDDVESNVVKITSRLLEIYVEEGEEVCLMAMHEIYGESSAENWLSKWSEAQEKSYYLDLLKVSRDWCLTNQINFTPEILINGKAFPKAYDRTDLIYFIEDLSEQLPSIEKSQVFEPSN